MLKIKKNLLQPIALLIMVISCSVRTQKSGIMEERIKVDYLDEKTFTFMKSDSDYVREAQNGNWEMMKRERKERGINLMENFKWKNVSQYTLMDTSNLKQYAAKDSFITPLFYLLFLENDKYNSPSKAEVMKNLKAMAKARYNFIGIDTMDNRSLMYKCFKIQGDSIHREMHKKQADINKLLKQ
jgi:hypothetical protein